MQRDALTTLFAYVLIFAVGITGSFGDILINKWAHSRGVVTLIGSYALWIISVTLLGYFLRWERYTFASAIVIAVIVHTIVAILADRYYFQGHITKLQWLGFILAGLSLILIEVGRESVD